MFLQRLVIVLTLVVCFGCASSASESRSSAQQRIRELEETLDKALRDLDAGTLERLWAPDYFVTNSLGKIVLRDNWLADFRAGRAHFSDVTTSDLLVRVYDDTAIATGVKSRTGTFDAKDASGDLRFTHVWIRTSGRWLLVASQSTRVK